MTLGLRDLAFLGGLTVAVGGYDTDAQTYITAVEAADGQALETAVKDAINAFVVGCKADGIWSAIKACCIMAGARTLAGALVPLVGPAPTSNNFGSEDYNRKTGVKGGADKWLVANRNNNADPQNNKHFAVYQTEAVYGNTFYGGVGWASGGETLISNYSNFGTFWASCNDFNWTNTGISFSGFVSGLVGVSRSQSSQFQARSNATTVTIAKNSQAPLNQNFYIYRIENTQFAPSQARLSFYSIGESLSLLTLDSRLATLMSALAAAIP